MKKLLFVLAATLALTASGLSTLAFAESAATVDTAIAKPGDIAAVTVVATTPASVGAADAAYAVVTVATSDTSWQAIRYEIRTGKAWKMENGSWRAIPDSVEPTASLYRVEMIALKADWGAIRIDLRSGRSWSATPEGWSEIAETH